MDLIKVNLGDISYDIQIGKGILQKIDFKQFETDKCAIITDSNVKNLYGKNLLKFIKDQGLGVELFDFPAGENSKKWEVAGKIGRALAKKEFNKNSLIIALGGGVVGDLAGFIASFYKRGISCIQIPTTLIGQIDSGIGGKTGVDIPEGKNLFGTFYQPKAVIIDIDFLKSLPAKEIQNGLAEAIKYGMIQNVELFKYLEENYLSRSEEFYLKTIKESVKIKVGIVEQDEKETELRKILNYGHTIGHAIETIEQYKISHGAAIGLGMAYEGRISNQMNLLSGKDLERQNKLIQAVGLPIHYKGRAESLIKAMKIDKKSKFGKIYFILPTKIGEIRREENQVAFPVDISLLEKVLD